jgi:hypothetical protein
MWSIIHMCGNDFNLLEYMFILMHELVSVYDAIHWNVNILRTFFRLS